MRGKHAKAISNGHRASSSALIIEAGGRGGVSDYTQQLADALDALGWHVELLTARDHLYRVPPSVTVHAVIPWVRERAPVGRLIRRTGLGQIVNALSYVAVLPHIVRLARRVDVVHMQGHHYPPLAALTSMAVLFARTPLVMTSHNTFDRGRSYPRSHRMMARAAEATIVHTAADEQRWRTRHDGRVSVIPHGEYGGLARSGGQADRASAREELGLSELETVALLFGQLRPDKGIGDLLQAAMDVPGLRVLLAGEDIGGLDAARSLIDGLGERVILREGYLPMNEAARLFAAADVVVLPYQVASQSGVLLLAYGFGRPVVAYPVGGLAEAVDDGQTGWLTAEADPAALAVSLREALEAGVAERLRRGDAGRRLAEERYSWTAIARRTAELYDAVRDRSRRL